MCVFLLFWYCVTIGCLILICTVCWIYLYFHFCWGVALSWINLLWAWILGIWISYRKLWTGHLDRCLLSRRLSWNFNHLKTKDLSFQVPKTDLCFSALFSSLLPPMLCIELRVWHKKGIQLLCVCHLHLSEFEQHLTIFYVQLSYVCILIFFV